ncbi:DNA-binding domain-containing protein [Sphingomonas sanxanigenens]|uniref:Putative DNA-binding domain-containing protein n=1 Tax=Sphingomonas sanxanigenens DSM 19645 = NX02 TaxID=1123269 RepID=W0AE17_9SPHN|nr:DNA-binding domain-containing protein [Sphingomonas sanxanigenens]AHE56129.1 hypothetical protein NX02_22550 [Sphingomonas sanxanigenens DSM 19645 = NX02]
MADLAGTQRAFLAQLIGDDGGNPGVSDGPHADAKRRLGIYRNAYRLTLRGAIRHNHRRCAAWLGDDRFDRAADDYATATPSPFRNLRDYGGGFATFLAVRFPDHPDIAELAALDWAIDAAFDGPDAAALDAAAVTALATDAWIERPLALHPAASLVEATHNLAPVWRALEAGETPPAMVPLGRRAVLLVWRMDGQPHFRTLDENEGEALRHVAVGASFAAICAMLEKRLGAEEATTAAGTMLGGWLRDGVLVWSA